VPCLYKSDITGQHRCKGKGHTNVLNRLSSFDCSIFWTWEDSQFLGLHHIQTTGPAHHNQHAWSACLVSMPGQHAWSACLVSVLGQHAWSTTVNSTAVVHADANGLFSHWSILFIHLFLHFVTSFIHPFASSFCRVRERGEGKKERKEEREGGRERDMDRGRERGKGRVRGKSSVYL